MHRDPHQLFDTPEQKADLEARNGLLQFDEVRKLIAESRNGFRLTPAILRQLQHAAIHDIYDCAGQFRTRPVLLERTQNDPNLHQPPAPTFVPALVDEMCTYVNDNFGKSALHLAAYLLWRHNWIHPFMGGNGRTSRALSYYVMCARLGYEVPGSPTVPEQIADSASANDRYFDALHAADAAAKEGRVDVTEMENLVGDCLAKQLYDVYESART